MGRQHPVTHKPWQVEDLEDLVLCPVCQQYTLSESWHGQCPMVETTQCTNRTLVRYTFDDDRFYPALDS